jgi:hypothetical protein
MEHGTETWKAFLADGRKLVGATPPPALRPPDAHQRPGHGSLRAQAAPRLGLPHRHPRRQFGGSRGGRLPWREDLPDAHRRRLRPRPRRPGAARRTHPAAARSPASASSRAARLRPGQAPAGGRRTARPGGRRRRPPARRPRPPAVRHSRARSLQAAPSTRCSARRSASPWTSASAPSTPCSPSAAASAWACSPAPAWARACCSA